MPGPVLPAQRRIDLFPFPALPPAPEVNVYVRPGGKIVGHHAPGDATTQDIQAAVKDVPQVVLTLRSAMLTLREELLVKSFETMAHSLSVKSAGYRSGPM